MLRRGVRVDPCTSTGNVLVELFAPISASVGAELGPLASGGPRCEVAAKRADRRTSAGDAVDACATSAVVSSEEDVRAIEPCTPHAAQHSATNYE